jgi:hypothetical protein
LIHTRSLSCIIGIGIEKLIIPLYSLLYKGCLIEPERESRIDTCVECVVRERDFSEKTVYRCELCDRWFCERHSEPRLAFIRDLNAIENSPEARALYYTEMKREDGHPDFAYTKMRLWELHIEEKNRNELIKQALDKMNSYYRQGQWKARQETTNEKQRGIMRSEGDLHFIKKKPLTYEPKRLKRQLSRKLRMRPWYWFLFILLVIGITLFALGEYYIMTVKNHSLGWDLSLYSILILGFLLAVAALYFERWRRKWWQR